MIALVSEMYDPELPALVGPAGTEYLTEIEDRLMARLMKRPGALARTLDLIEAGWPDDQAPESLEGALRTHIQNLRAKAGRVGWPWNVIVNQRGQGYRINLAVRPVGSNAGEVSLRLVA
jgi:DNA-binding response OmpR family regulator